MQQKARKYQRKSNTFEAGDLVTIASRFFNNHGEPHVEHGIGQIKELEHGTPYVWVEFSSHDAFNRYIEMAYISEMDKRGWKTLIKIHPVYLDKIEIRRKKDGKEK